MTTLKWHDMISNDSGIGTLIDKVEYVDYSKMYTTTKTNANTNANTNIKKAAPPRIKKVLFRHPATIVFWDDNTKTVVKCSENDYFDCEKGLAMAIAKKFFGNEGNYYNEFKKWLPKEEEIDLDPVTLSFTTAREALERLSEALKNSYGESNEVIVEGE